jgi:uncharacterized protein (TIGR03084 family)
MAIFDDLEAEQDRLEGILSGLDEAQWTAPSAASGWSVADVVLHLAQTEEAVVASAAGDSMRLGPASGTTVDQMADDMVSAERDEPAAVFGRWREARRAAVSALRAADPGQPLSWVETPLKPATLATTRLAEHWAHGLDITGPLGVPFPDTDRLRHVAWLAHRSLPYAFALAGEGAPEVRCDLTAPDGAARWRFGPDAAGSAISGPAGAFCRVAAQRLPPGESGLAATGPHGAAALRYLRTYAA